MTASPFDALLTHVARQTTRRAALATLLGSVLRLPAPGASGATDRAHRRHQRHGNDAALKDIFVTIINPGPKIIDVQYGTKIESIACCSVYGTKGIIPGGGLIVRSDRALGYVWIADKYWFDFLNPAIGPPNVWAAVDGVAETRGYCCFPLGSTLVRGTK